MRTISLLLFSMLVCSVSLRSQTNKLYDDTRVSSMYLLLNPDSLQVMINDKVNDRYMAADFIFDDGNTRDTVPTVGLRLRGNTSLHAQKKSFKISFNEYVPGRRYEGVKKVNLRGSHNDPSCIREKIWFEIAESAGDPERRASFVRLYINDEYRGLYTNLEEVDKEWLERAYADADSGNLYKCTWPADLQYLGPQQSAYTSILNNPAERAYDLVTNDATNYYAGFINMVRILNLPTTTPAYRDTLEKVLDVESVLRGFALNIATGHWDDYFYNKNNYYLYEHPVTGRFSFFSFDTDNTMGIDWLSRDWSTRNALSWQKGDQPRPLATQLMDIPAYKQRFVDILDSITLYITHPDSIEKVINYYHTQVTPAAIADTYRTLDYGYSISQFFNSIDQTIDDHSPWGIKPFFGRRYSNTLAQIGPLSTEQVISSQPLALWPNPVAQTLYLPISQGELAITHASGQVALRTYLQTASLDVSALASGMYFVRVLQDGQVYVGAFVKE